MLQQTQITQWEETKKPARKKGFTLVELMVTTAIIGILAAIAVVGYVKWVDKAKLAKAETFLALIKTKQEAYHNRFGFYLSAGPNPTAAVGTNTKYLETWETTGANARWIQLGAKPGLTRVQFQYITRGGSGGGAETCAASSNRPHNAVCAGTAGTGAWFWASAENAKSIVIVNSVRPNVWVLAK